MYRNRQATRRLLSGTLLGLMCAVATGNQASARQRSENDSPVFTEGAATTRSLAENTEGGRDLQHPVSATDSDGHRLTYGLGGQDADSFALDSRNGQLRSLDGVDYDYEVKDRYDLTIRAEDGHGGSSVIAVVVEVTDELEPPSVPDKPTIAETTRNGLTVQWTAPANTGPELRDYDGQFRVSGEGAFVPGWDRIGAVTEATISGLSEDTLYEVQVRARTAEGAGGWSESAEERTATNHAPTFNEGSSTTRQLVENTAAGMNVGAPVTASDADGDQLVYSLEQPEQTAFRIDSSSGQLSTRAGATYDYENQQQHTVTVRVDDGHEGSATIVVTVSITDVDDATIVANAGWDLTVAAGRTAWLDGRASSTDQGEPTYSWSFLSWPGSSQPALADPATTTPSFVAAAEGSYVVRLTVTKGTSSATDDVVVVARPSTEAAALVQADLLVDANRDGLVDQSDEAGEETWDAASGAVFGPNTDDDDGDGIRDAWDDRANGDADLLDMAPAVVRRIPGLHRKHSVVVKMTYVSRSTRPQLFYDRTGGAVELLIGGGDLQAELPLDQLVAGDVRLYLDSRMGRDSGFDGELSLTLTVKDDGTTVSRDTVALRGSPILFTHHLQSVERVFVLEDPFGSYGSNTRLVNALTSHLPSSVDLYKLGASKYGWDRWVQDSMETGYVQRPSIGGVETAVVHTQLYRGRGLERFLPSDYLGAEAGYVSPGGRLQFNSFNYGGNVEVIPPHAHNDKTFPFGRIVLGGRSNPGLGEMDQQQRDFFNAQKVQGPAIVVDTSWLTVGHVDEIFSVLPNHSAGPDERSWVIAIGSPDLAIDLLEKAVDDGYADAFVFGDRAWDETTPREILADDDLLEINEYAQGKIDTVRDRLIATVGLEDADFREVPALFYEDEFGLLAALIPNIQNLLVADDVLFVPDPEGPKVDGADVWRQATLDAVDGLGLTTHFVDVYYSYHVLIGAIHCGTNAENEGSVTPWWLEVETEETR